MKIGIVGRGYVGTAVKSVFEKHYDILTYDIDRELSNCQTLEDVVRDVGVIFVLQLLSLFIGVGTHINITSEPRTNSSKLEVLDNVFFISYVNIS